MRSTVWKISKAELEEIVQSSQTKTEILNRLNLYHKGGNARTLVKRCNSEGIDLSHLLGLAWAKGKIRPELTSKTPIQLVLTENSSVNRSRLKARLLREGLIENVCAICGQLPEWNGKPLVLQLDHINGISDDNRLENLRIICGHCHSQTDTFAGRNKKRDVSIVQKLPELKVRERKLIVNVAKSKIKPSAEILEKLLWEKPTLQIAEDFGVSDKAVEKWAKSYGLSKPGRGYWQKNKKVSPIAELP